MKTYTPNNQYVNSRDWLKSVRVALEGEPCVKNEREFLLKHPSMNDQKGDEHQRRYNAYIDGAEFDEYPSATESAMIGRATSGEHVIELSASLEHLIDNADGDGTTLSGLVEMTYRDVLAAKFKILIAEFDSLTITDKDNITVADVQNANAKSKIKSYSRENLIDWDFARDEKGVLRLTYAVLREDYQETNEAGVKESFESYLELGLDDEGYYQQLYVKTSDGPVSAEGEKVRPKAAGSNLDFIPLVIASDEPLKSGEIPKDLGFLSKLCFLALARYRVSADYKEALRFMQPTTFTKGWRVGDKDLFEELNGRPNIAFGVGVANNLPENVQVDVVGLGIQSEPYERYFEENEKKARALGAVFPSDNQNESATGASINDANATAALVSLIKNTEAAIAKVISYCAMFEGDQSPLIDINLYKDLGRVKLSAQDQQAIINNFTAGLISRQEAMRQLEQGGVTIGDAEQIIDELNI